MPVNIQKEIDEFEVIMAEQRLSELIKFLNRHYPPYHVRKENLAEKYNQIKSALPLPKQQLLLEYTDEVGKKPRRLAF